MRTAANLLLLMLFITAAVAAAPRFELNDGSVISGTVLKFENGVYTVDSASLGRVQIDQKNVRNIVYGGQTPAPPGNGENGVSPAQIQAIQTSMAQDSGLMALIQALQNDPEMQSILADPEITRAVAAGDFTALVNNKKIIQLMENPKIKTIVDQAQGR